MRDAFHEAADKLPLIAPLPLEDTEEDENHRHHPIDLLPPPPPSFLYLYISISSRLILSCELAHNNKSQFVCSSRVNKAVQEPIEIGLDDAAQRPMISLDPSQCTRKQLTSTYDIDYLTRSSC